MALAVNTACHTYTPSQDVVPASGREVAVELNDRGRALVGGQLGESVLQVRGRIIGSTDSEVTLSVTRTVLLQGSSVVWTGEQVVIPREGVRSFRLREFSRGRTAMLAIGITVFVAVVGAGISLLGGGNGRPIDGGGCTSGCGTQ